MHVLQVSVKLYLFEHLSHEQSSSPSMKRKNIKCFALHASKLLQLALGSWYSVGKMDGGVDGGVDGDEDRDGDGIANGTSIRVILSMILGKINFSRPCTCTIVMKERRVMTHTIASYFMIQRMLLLRSGLYWYSIADRDQVILESE